MAVFTPQSLKITPPSGGFQQGGWYNGRQFWNGTLSEPGVIHPDSNQVGAGQTVSPEVNAQSARQQGVSPQQFESYLQTQRQQAVNVTPSATSTASMGASASAGGTSGGTAGGVTGLGLTTPSTINLPEIYKNLYATSGISDLENSYSQLSKEYTEAKGKINDNPFLSEATRVGRIAKIESLFNERTANLKNDIATKKADIETQLNLQTKQFDIDSENAKNALSYFNTLLDAGALNTASGEDIATITRTTGIPSSLIYSAIKSKTANNANTQVITSTNDYGEVTVSVVDKNTGEIIKQTSLGKVGNAEQGAKATEAEKKEYYSNALREDAGKGDPLSEILQKYWGYLDANTIYGLYNASSMYGVDKNPQQSIEYMKKYYQYKDNETYL